MKTRYLTLIPLLMAVSIGGLLLPFPGAAKAEELTYENFGQAFITQNCLGCHHSAQSGITRFGAPEGINFDTLQQIRMWEPMIRYMATGPNPQMPPAGVVWPWDREKLVQWLDAGLPGEADTLTPVDDTSNEVTLSYQSVEFDLYKPWNAEDNERVIRTRALTDNDTEVGELEIGVVRYNNGAVLMTYREWDDFRRHSYNPPVPILLPTMDDDEVWSATVNVSHEHSYNNRWIYDGIAPQRWRVENVGLETIDNGVVLPMEAYRVKQTNVSDGVEHSWWYAQGIGLVRRETVLVSEDYAYEVVREMFVHEPDDPLDAPDIIDSASREWLPFRGRWSSTSYGHVFEQQAVGVVDVDFEPTATPTEGPLPYYSTPSPTPNNPTATPVVPGLPSPQPTWTPTLSPTLTPAPTATPTATPTSTETPTPTETPRPTDTPPPVPTDTPVPTATPEPGMTPTPFMYDLADPRSADVNRDKKVDKMDLMHLLQFWHGEME